MQVLNNQVFSDKQIVTCSLIAKDFKCSIDEANKIMYEFYQKNRENLEAYFIVVRKDGDTKIVIDRIPEQRLNYLLYDQEYSTSIISLKIWAVYDRSQGELEVSNIYEVEDADLHCIQNLCYNLRDLDLKKAEHQAKRAVAATPAKASQTSTKKPQAANNTVDKPKLATPTNPKDNQENAKRANMPEVTSKAHETVKRAKTLEEEPPAKAEEQAKANAKKRKGDDVTPMAEAVGQDKELKKTKTGNIFDSFAQKDPKETKQQKEQKQQKEKEQKEKEQKEQKEREQREKEEKMQKEKQQQEQEQKQKQQQQQQQKSSKIEVEAEEESYYPDDPDTMVVEKPKQQQPSKLKTFATFESKKTLTSQSSFSQYDDAFDDPSPIRESVPYREPAKPKQVEKPVEKPVETFSNEEPQEEFTQVRRVRKVPREKTYMDEKGYLIVENELVDEEYWETVRTKPAAQNKINNSNNNDISSKKKAPEKNQATLASFFRKK